MLSSSKNLLGTERQSDDDIAVQKLSKVKGASKRPLPTEAATSRRKKPRLALIRTKNKANDTSRQPKDESLAEAPLSPATIRAQKQAVLETSNAHQQAALQKAMKHEAKARKSAPKRWNAAINPLDDEFKTKYLAFTKLLNDPKRTTQQVLDGLFTTHERELVTAVEKSRDPVLHRLQQDNKDRYEALLQSKRFEAWQDSSDLAFKFTLLYFGLPVAPMTVDYQQKLAVWDEKTIQEDMGKDDPPPKEYLRFLNSYGQRYFGRDHLRLPDPVYECYYAQTGLYRTVPKKASPVITDSVDSSKRLSLRGGGRFYLYGFDDDGEQETDFKHASDDDSEVSDHEKTQTHRVTAPKVIGAYPNEERDEASADRTARVLPGEKRVRFETPEEPSTSSRRGSKPRNKDHGRRAPTEEELARHQRESAYDKPLSTATEQKIPVNAPPVEKVLNTGSPNVPRVVLGVLTPTEQQQLQLEVQLLRNTALQRSQRCPYRGCDRVFRVSEPDRLQQHLDDAHVAERCNFCDEPLYKHWSKQDRRLHFLSKHLNEFAREGDADRDNSFNFLTKRVVSFARESRWNFCSRCCRDHRLLDSQADRTHHDNHCNPELEIGPNGFKICDKCGTQIHGELEDHECVDALDEKDLPFCEKCGLPCGLFTKLYQEKHKLACRGVSKVVDAYCPWCGCVLGDMDKLEHLRHCARRPDDTAEGPLNPETGKKWPSPAPKQKPKPGECQDPPEWCPKCDLGISHMGPHMLMKHLEDTHGGPQMSCIFCTLDYVKRGWINDRAAKIEHLNDHRLARRLKLSNDMTLALGLPDDHELKVNASTGGIDYEELKLRTDLKQALEDIEKWQKEHQELENRLARNEKHRQELKTELEKLRNAAKTRPNSTRKKSDASGRGNSKESEVKNTKADKDVTKGEKVLGQEQTDTKGMQEGLKTKDDEKEKSEQAAKDDSATKTDTTTKSPAKKNQPATKKSVTKARTNKSSGEDDPDYQDDDDEEESSSSDSGKPNTPSSSSAGDDEPDDDDGKGKKAKKRKAKSGKAKVSKTEANKAKGGSKRKKLGTAQADPSFQPTKGEMEEAKTVDEEEDQPSPTKKRRMGKTLKKTAGGDGSPDAAKPS